MSYCRFSSLNWRCDVYVYEHVHGGYVTHVAAMRKAIPPIPDLLTCRLSMKLHRWSGADFDVATRTLVYPNRMRAAIYRLWLRFICFWHDRIHMAFLDLIPMRKIGLPFDGETFNDETPEECAVRLQTLSRLGYIVPLSAIEALRADADHA